MSLSESHILIIDDDPDFVEVMTLELKGRGAVVIPAFSGADAQKYLQKSEVDIVICDLILPDMNGSGLIHSILTKTNVDIVYILSGDAEGAKDLAEHFAGRAFAFAKPFDWKLLIKHLEAQFSAAPRKVS